MGVKANISMSKFPRQGKWLGKWCNVCFHYDTQNVIRGQCVRDDAENPPGLTIFRLDDGRYVLATECQHTMPE
jgi:hypothetical protein